MDKPKIQLSSVVRRAQQFLTAAVGDSLTMAGDDPEYLYRLDGVGKRVWELVDKPVRVSEVCAALQEEFHVEPEGCQRDVVAFLEQLRDKGLVEVSEKAPDATSG